MAKSINLIRRAGLLFSAILLLTSGCGSRGASRESEPEQEIEIFYHADDGEFNRGIEWGRPAEESAVEDKESTAEDEEKTVITLATLSDAVGENEISLIEEIVVQFNKENEKYCVELRTCRSGGELATMQDRLSVEVGAGGGPDIMTETVFPVTQEIMDSGVLVNLTPYLEKSGVTPETFFPAYASAVSGDRIYGVSPTFKVKGYSLDAELLGDREPPEDVGAMADLLLEYPGHGSFITEMYGGRYILKFFLEGSEDLWGMIDWEKKTCDFTGPLFSKLLEVSKRYREDGKKGYEPVVYNYYVGVQMPPSYSVSVLCPGSIPVGFFFDDGPHYKYDDMSSMLMINANTEHLEGAYAFVSYVLSRGGQDFYGEPMQKELWDITWQYYSEISGYNSWISAPLNEETRQETIEAYEDARYVPRRAEAVLEIVYEEAEGYIEGDRSKEEVIDLIQNRVQLYLDEQR